MKIVSSRMVVAIPAAGDSYLIELSGDSLEYQCCHQAHVVLPFVALAKVESRVCVSLRAG